MEKHGRRVRNTYSTCSNADMTACHEQFIHTTADRLGAGQCCRVAATVTLSSSLQHKYDNVRCISNGINDPRNWHKLSYAVDFKRSKKNENNIIIFAVDKYCRCILFYILYKIKYK